MYTSEELVQSFRLHVGIYRYHESNIKPYLVAGSYGSELLNKEALKEFLTSKDVLINYLSDTTKQCILITADDDLAREAAQELIKEFDL